MAQALPGPWFIGKCTVSLTLTPQTINSAGNSLTDGTPVTFTAVYDSMEIDLQARTENIKPASLGFDNEVIISDSMSCRITEIIPASGNSLLAVALLASDYFKVQFQAAPNNGAGTAGKTWTIFLVRKSVTPQFNEGKSTATAQFGPCGVAPAFA